MDDTLRTELRALAPPMADPDDLLAAVHAQRARRARRNELLGLAAAAAFVVVTAVTALAVGTGSGTRPAVGTAATGPGPLRPPCRLPIPFTGFAPNTDSAIVNRVRGSAPTRLAAHATTSDLLLADLRVDVVDAGQVLRSARLGTARAAGQDLPIQVGDVADDGTRIAPGRYDVMVNADVTGRDECGVQVTHHVQTRAGILVVR
jgi:hypothetical protein